MNKNIGSWLEKNADSVQALAKDLFDHPEAAYDEHHAADAAAAYMEKQGFEVRKLNPKDQDGEPNCVVARYGSGKPVIGFLGELDALPALGQCAVPQQDTIPGPGHGCGHHLIGSSAAGAASAMKYTMEQEGLKGTIVYYGCPAEEVLSGKVYMAKRGLFDDLDAAVTWHPMGFAPRVLEDIPQSNNNLYFTFHGKSAHAAASPHEGRSALDACELMNVGVNYLREHVPTDTRMHYSYISAGDKPNIVPDIAKLHYFVRTRDTASNEEVTERVIECAKGAAIMTGTTMEWQQNAYCHESLLNHTLNRVMHAAMEKVPELAYDDADREFARTLYKNFSGKEAKGEVLSTKLPPLKETSGVFAGSTDVCEVSQIAPTVQIFGGGVVDTLPQHHWSTTAASGSSIGMKALLYACKCLAQCSYDLFTTPDLLESAWAEFKETRKDMKPYKAGVPD